jgi:hypothetical protein
MNLHDKIKLLETGLVDLFPGLVTQIMKTGTLSAGLDTVTGLHVFVSHRNSHLIKSDYSYEKKLVHFTSGLSLQSILQERSLRLYNLYNLNDPREFEYASKVLELDEATVSHAKKNLFVLSCCEPTIFENVTHEFNMWRLYGQNGRGIAIVFSIYNRPEDWMDFHLSRVFYGDQQIDKFKEIRDLINKSSLDLPKVTIDLSKLIPFHKSTLFSLEHEVRLISDRMAKYPGTSSQIWFDLNEDTFPEMKSDIHKIVERKDEVQFLTIPIYKYRTRNYDSKIPVIKIERIIIGYNYLEDELINIQNCISNLCRDHIGFVPEISCTSLRNQYFGI